MRGAHRLRRRDRTRLIHPAHHAGRIKKRGQDRPRFSSIPDSYLRLVLALALVVALALALGVALPPPVSWMLGPMGWPSSKFAMNGCKVKVLGTACTWKFSLPAGGGTFMGLIIVIFTSGTLAWMPSSVTDMVTLSLSEAWTLPRNFRGLSLMAFQTVSFCSCVPLVRMKIHCPQSISSGLVLASQSWICCSGVGGVYLVTLVARSAGGSGSFLAWASSWSQPSSEPWNFL